MLSILVVMAAAIGPVDVDSKAPFQVGTAKVDVTPTMPLRLSGYSNRNQPFEAVEDKLFARSIVLRDANGTLTALSAVEVIGVTSAMRQEVLTKLESIGVRGERFVLLATHTHTGPHLEGYAPNLFAPRMEAGEKERMRQYTGELVDKIAQSVLEAHKRLEPARIEQGWGVATFAANRRLVKDGLYQGFGVQPDGAVEHRVPVFRVNSADGKPIAILFGYACHATTLGGDFNRVSPDWPGYACRLIEEAQPGSLAIPMIGCGADANPEPRGTLDMAKAHGRSLATAVINVLKKPLTPIDAPPSANFGYVGLPPDRPTAVELTARLVSKDLHVRQHAQDMLKILEHKDRLPETYPAPIQVLRFGDQFTLIFLGGEVVVDYSIRLRRELAQEIPEEKLWVGAYANDVYGYLASERIRNEGGYEFDSSMNFYNQPGPWESGTENTVIARVLELVRNPAAEGNVPAEKAASTMRVAEGLEVELVAAEPLIADPVNIAFGPDGRLWVAEMGDYPHGPDGPGSKDSRVRYLEDTDGDGKFDKSTLFLDQLLHATGVHPWKDGVLVSSCPEVFFARADKGAGPASHRQAILTGFGKGNPQHVVNGFAVGIDNWLYVNGDETGTITSAATGKKVGMQGLDGRFKPTTGELETECGMTQHLRSRDDWGYWFGGANYCPVWHYVLEEKYLRRNPHVAWPRPWQELHDGFYPQVFPASRIVDRFNDLFTAGKFTSACSPMPYRDTLLGEGSDQTVFACEPVHNLVNRSRMTRKDLEFHADRFEADASSEFFASTDTWSRPVRVITGPEGSVWVVDMYRLVIEHPNWIPQTWLERLDVRAGHDKGRIYRVYPKGKRPQGHAIPRLVDRTPTELVDLLESENGWTRDTAQQLLMTGNGREVVADIEKVARTSSNPKARLHALGTLEGLGALRPELLEELAESEHPQVRRWAIRFAEPFLKSHSSLARKVASLANDSDIDVRFQVACSLGDWNSPESADALARLAQRDVENAWMRYAILSSATHHPARVLKTLLAEGAATDARRELVDGLLATTIGELGESGIASVIEQITPQPDGAVEAWHLDALASLLDALTRRDTNLMKWASSASASLVGRVSRVVGHARELAVKEDADANLRAKGVMVLGRGPDFPREDRQLLIELLIPSVPVEVQTSAVSTLGKLGEDEIAKVLLASWRAMGPAVRSEALSVLTSRPEWASALVDALVEGRVTAAEIDASRRQELLEHSNLKIRERAAQVLAEGQGSRQEVLDANKSVLTLEGNAVKGRELFTKHCSSCHRFGGVGNSVGPELATLRDRSPAYLLPALLDPNRAVEAKYVSYAVQLKDGRALSGMILSESSGSLTLARPDGKQEKILRSDVDEMASSGRSFMPEGLEKDLSPQDLADLCAFLRETEK